MKFLPLLLVAALFGCQQISQPEITRTPYTPDSGSVAVHCGALIDGLSNDVIEDRLIVIHHGRIAAVVAGGAEVPLGMPFLDLGEHTCLPGLINTHVHLGETPESSVDYGVYYDRSAEDHNTLVLELAADNLLSGFTTVRNVGDFFPGAIYYGRNQIDSGKAIGPRIRTAGPFLTIPGGGGSLAVPYRDESEIPEQSRLGEARGPDEFREKAKLAVAEGADFLKVIASGAVFSFGVSPGAPEMTQDEIAAVVDGPAAGMKREDQRTWGTSRLGVGVVRRDRDRVPYLATVGQFEDGLGDVWWRHGLGQRQHRDHGRCQEEQSHTAILHEVLSK